MNMLKRLELAAEFSEGVGDGPLKLPDAAAVAANCRSWGVDALLKFHQAEGVAWLIRRYIRGVNVILGDEMGLGKTLQSIAFLAYLVSEQHCSGPFLILSPLSVTDGWASELARFAPSLAVLSYVGDKKEREGFRKTICDHVNKQPLQSQSDPALPFQVLLTTYELALLDAKFLSLFRWRYTIIDEAQRLKNPSTILYQALQEQYMMPRRLLLTGTPVQNNLSELWSLLHFCMPAIFDNLDNFMAGFGPVSLSVHDATEESAKVKSESASSNGSESAKQCLKLLRNILRAFMLRRTKANLISTKALSLPPVVEVTVFAPLVPLQKKVYISLLRKELPNVTCGDTGSTSKKSLQNIVVQLRKACSHPYLFDGVEPEPFIEGEHLVQASGKLIILDLMLERLRAQGHRVLLFAQMTRTLDIVQDYLQFRGYTYERLDGSIRAEERFAAVRNFSATRTAVDCDDAFVFLLTTRAGGVGLNLVAADTVIFFEQDWNPQADQQAMQRAHRIGQLRSVLVINLITENTIEEVIMRRARMKLQLAHDVMRSDDAILEENGPTDMKNSDLQSMIVFGLQKIVSQPVPCAEETGTTLMDNIGVTSKMITIVESALEQREKNDTLTSEGDKYLNDLLKGNNDNYKVGLLGTKSLGNLVRDGDDDDKENFLALKSLAMDVEHGASENNGRRVRKLAPLVDDAEAVAKKKQKKGNLQSKWNSLGYKSFSVSESDAKDKDNDHINEEDIEYIHQLVGDCTKPSLASGERGIILWCVDNSGTWGKGGLFGSLAQLSAEIPEAYEAAYEAGDLNLGDLHLIPVPGMITRTSTSSENEDENETLLWAALAVVQSYNRRRKVPRSDVSFTDLEICIRKLAASAAELSASVHMPRIHGGMGDGKQGWYVVERLLRKYAKNSSVHFNVYYFKRNV